MPRLAKIALAALLAVGLAASPHPADAAPPPEPTRVVCTLQVLGDIARQVGGDRVEVEALATGHEDAHYVDPTPSLMSSVRGADLFCEIGLQYELWAERVLDGAGNPGVRRGTEGHVYASDGISRKQRPRQLDRSQGDLHPDGNPHVWLDPLNAMRIGRNIADGLIRVDPDGEATYEENLATFEDRVRRALYGDELVELFGERAELLDRLTREGRLLEVLEERTYEGTPLIESLGGWMGRGRPLRGQAIIFYHKSWIYLTDRFGLEIVDYVEEQPGIEPGPAHLEELRSLVESRGIPVVAHNVFYPAATCRSVAEPAGAVVVELPNDVGGVPEASGYVALIDVILDRLLEAYGAE